MPVSYDSSDTTPAIYVINENAEWTAPLYHALDELDSSHNRQDQAHPSSAPLYHALDELGLVYYDWNLATVSLNLSAAAPQGIFYNRMSASSHSRGNRYAAEMTVGVLAWLEGQGRTVLNGRSALHLEISKLIQYAALRQAGLNVPKTIASADSDDVIAAYSAFDGMPVITKHNRAGKGLGVQLFRSEKGLISYVRGDEFFPSVDGITLVQRYIA